MLKLLKSVTTKIVSAGTMLLTIADANAELFGPNPGGSLGTTENARGSVIDLISAVLNFMALIAVIVIIIAGIRLLVSSGDEGSIEKGKKTIIWAVIGLIVILLAGAIVDFVGQIAPTPT